MMMQAAPVEEVMSGPVMQTGFFEALLQQELANGSYADCMQLCADDMDVIDVKMTAAGDLASLLEHELLNAAEGSATGWGSAEGPAALAAPAAAAAAGQGGVMLHMPQPAAGVATQAAARCQMLALQQQLEEQQQLAVRQQQLAEQLQQHRQARQLLQRQLMTTLQPAASAAAAAASYCSMGMCAAALPGLSSTMPLSMAPPAAAADLAALFPSVMKPQASAGLQMPFGTTCQSSSMMMSHLQLPTPPQPQQQLVFPHMSAAPMPAPHLAASAPLIRPGTNSVINTVGDNPVRAGDHLEVLLAKLDALRNEYQAMEHKLLQLQVLQNDRGTACPAAAAVVGCPPVRPACAGSLDAGELTWGFQQQQQLQQHAPCWQQQQQMPIGSCGVFSNGVCFFV
jgi:hypothetical protein